MLLKVGIKDYKRMISILKKLDKKLMEVDGLLHQLSSIDLDVDLNEVCVIENHEAIVNISDTK